MNRAVYLNHTAAVTGLGSLDATWRALLEGRSGIVKKEHFANSLLPATGLSLFTRDLSTEQVDTTQWLMEQCLAGFPSLPPETFVIWTGIKNTVEDIERSVHGETGDPRLASAHDYRQWVGERLGLSNGGMEINAACASSTVGAALAARYIAAGMYDHVLVVGADIVSRFVYYGFAALKAMTEEICLPFDLHRKGLSLGDGAVALFLSAERSADIQVSGYGITNDANHITGPSRDGLGLAKALRQAMAMAGVAPDDVPVFCAHGTGTSYNDSMELAAARSVFRDDPPMIFGVKGAIGHTLGAAGGIEIALCGKCLAEELIPPTVGCKNPESPAIVMDKTPFPGERILTSNSGFGGVNAAVLLEKIS